MSVRPATVADLDDARGMFREYQASLGIDLGFQGFEAELASLPAPYDAISLAANDGALAGCAAIKPLGDGVCELKRLYVRPAFRGHGAGRALCEAMIFEAEGLGYGRMRLDTLARLSSAVALYRRLGFVEIPPYYDNPLAEEVLYLERALDRQPP